MICLGILTAWMKINVKVFLFSSAEFSFDHKDINKPSTPHFSAHTKSEFNYDASIKKEKKER